MTEETTRPSWLPIGVAGALVVAALSAVVLLRPDPLTCSTPSKYAGPLLAGGEIPEAGDERLTKLADSVEAMDAPFGDVVAGVGYDYDQWLHLYGLDDALVAFTKDNPELTVIDGDTMRARWSVEPATKRIAWDASGDRFLLLDLAKGKPTRVGSYDLKDGGVRWCVELTSDHQDGEPVATAFLNGGDVLVALPDSKRTRVVRLDGADGSTMWSRRVSGVDRADFLAPFGKDDFVLGGAPAYRLTEPDPDVGDREVVSVFSAKDGRKVWDWSVSNGSQVHLTGVTADRITGIVSSGDETTLLAWNERGRPTMLVPTGTTSSDATLRDGVALFRYPTGLAAYDVNTARKLWEQTLPGGRTYFPYGFTLDQAPSVDSDTVLLPTTTGLRTLDVRTGEGTTYPLPTDGIRTTYWPYQLAVTRDAIAVVTNTAAVVAERR